MNRIRKASSKKSSSSSSSNKKGSSSSSSGAAVTAEDAGFPSDAAEYLKSLEDVEVIERVRCVINDAHVFKLPARKSAGGWRGGDWDQEVWQGIVKVVERGNLTVVLLVDRTTGGIFAVCPVKDGAVDRCVDSSRYFVVRVENTNGNHMFIGMAFNERNDAFDFNIALDDARREKEKEASKLLAQSDGASSAKLNLPPAKDYSLKEGEKIKVSIPKKSKDYDEDGGEKERPREKRNSKSSNSKSGGLFLKPSKKDTPRRLNA